MPADRPTFTVDVSDTFLLAGDLNIALNALPDDLKIEMAPIVQRVRESRLLIIDEVGGALVSRPTALFSAFAAFVDRLADEVEATRA